MRRISAIMLITILTLSLSPAMFAAKVAKKEKKTPMPATLNHEMTTITGEKVTLGEKYAGKVIMIVNVASECGATPQYKDLQSLYEKYKDKGFVVLGMPCNQFGKQEPGSDLDIKKFCEAKYAVTFPMFSKIDVKGKNQTSLYKIITSKEHCPSDPGDVKWNFEKILLGLDGKVAARFRTGVNPSSDKVVKAIEAQLGKNGE